MRKLFLWAVLASLLCGAGAASAIDAVPSEAITGFGLYKVYSTDHPVILRADGEPYYGDVKKLVGTEIFFAAKVKDGYSGAMPHGTLTDRGSGFYYRLSPYYSSRENIYRYYASGFDLSESAGHKVMWNILTSPDVTVGAAVIPEVSTLSREIAPNEVVPYVRINHASGNVYRVDLSFVRSGDWSTPVALGDTTVRVYLNNSDYGYWDSWEFTNFNKAVRKSFTLYQEESSVRNFSVEYEKDGAKYIWNFVPMFGGSGIEWGKLDLANQPLTISADSSVDIVIKLPAKANLSKYFEDDSYYGSGSFIQPGNRSVVAVDDSSVSFEQGTAEWDGFTLSEDKSTLSFRLLGRNPGRTMLSIPLPEVGNYYREIHVVSADGDMHLEASDDTHGTRLYANEYQFRAKFVNGKPYYPSAEFTGANFALKFSGDVSIYDGRMGIVKGTTQLRRRKVRHSQS